MRQLMTRLGLTVNKAKTRLVRLPEESFDFLGYSVGRFYGKDGVPYNGTIPSRKAKTAIFVTWDDRGGWFDHVEPPVVETWNAQNSDAD
jgi:hypothetical protein